MSNIKNRWVERFSQACVVSLFLLLIFGSHSDAVTDIASNAEIVTDQNTVKEILMAFQQAEKSLKSEQLSEMMANYSSDYENRGLHKAVVKEIWRDIFCR